MPKNASSTLREAFKNERYGATYEVNYSDIDLYKKQEYFTFTVLRDPVSRLLSSYQEVCMRQEMKSSAYADHDFFHMEDDELRLNKFIDSIENNQWDTHLVKLSERLKNIRIDFYMGQEWLQQDIELVHLHLGINECPVLLRRYSRLDRQYRYAYAKYFCNEEDLSRQTVERILNIYRKDMELYNFQVLDRYVMEGSFLNRFKIQNQQCSRYLVYHLGDRGLFAEISTISRAMMYALSCGRQLMIDSTEFSYRFELGWMDYFESFCAIYDPSVCLGDVMHCYSNVRGPGTVFDEVLSYNPEVFQFDGLVLREFFTILGRFTHAIYRLNDAVKKEVLAMSEEIGLPESYTAVHIRRGDKVGDEDVHYSFQQYWKELVLAGSDDLPLFVLSDDYQAIVEVREWLRESNFDNTVFTLCDETHTGYDVFAMRQGQACYNVGSDTQPQNEAEIRTYMYRETILVLAEVELASRADFFIGTYASNVSKTVWFLKNNAHCELIYEN
ncbi:MAG: sulfotransferase family 2 domain-containing protein [Gammaproteobacteria bacterium]|nr:sulfotransferase family 2 domain-containing protein [Gammaproteobacteria bacterium]